ncbi:MAG TPA: LCP family protein [Acidimicrobiales bacterium]
MPGGDGARPPGRVRRAWRRRWVKLVATTAAAVVVATASGVAWLAWRYSHVDRVGFADGVLAEEADGQPQNFLLVGSDSRAFVEDPREREAYGTEAEVGAPHADTILLARTFPADDRIAIVSFPRDLWVELAGAGGEGRINQAIEGGESRLVETITAEFGIPIHHFVQIDFRGFKGLVDAVGGVDVHFASPVRDWDPEKNLSPTGLLIETPGCVRLNGDVALAYVRSRHFQRLVEGTWQADPTGDLNRITRQQDFLRRTLRRVLSRQLLDPRRAARVLSAAEDYVRLDDTMSYGDVMSFGSQFRSLSPESLETYSLPTRPGRTSGGADVLYLDASAAEPVLDVFRGKTDRPAVLLPGSVRLRVVDATGRKGELNATAFRLAAAGFNVAGFGTADQRSRATVIRYGPGQAPKADLLADQLRARPVLDEDPTLAGVDVVLELGRDFRGVTEPVASAATTAPPGAAGGGGAATTVAPPAAVPPAEEC